MIIRLSERQPGDLFCHSDYPGQVFEVTRDGCKRVESVPRNHFSDDVIGLLTTNAGSPASSFDIGLAEDALEAWADD